MVRVDGSPDVGCEVFFRAGRADGGKDGLARRHAEVGDKTEGSVTAVLKLDFLRLPRQHRQGGMDTFDGLNAGLLVDADDVGALLVKTRRLCIGLADLPHVGLILDRILQFVLGCQPVAALVWTEIPPFRMRPT